MFACVYVYVGVSICLAVWLFADYVKLSLSISIIHYTWTKCEMNVLFPHKYANNCHD